MGFFDNLKNSLTETGQDLSQKAKDTTEIFRLTNLNKTKEKKLKKSFTRLAVHTMPITGTNAWKRCRSLQHRSNPCRMRSRSTKR